MVKDRIDASLAGMASVTDVIDAYNSSELVNEAQHHDMLQIQSGFYGLLHENNGFRAASAIVASLINARLKTSGWLACVNEQGKISLEYSGNESYRNAQFNLMFGDSGKTL